MLHLYSGQRREGDLQYWYEHIASDTNNYILFLSIDIANNEVKGDLTKWTTTAFWIDQMHKGRVAAIIAGPPCETWSAARTIPIEGMKHPPTTIA